MQSGTAPRPAVRSVLVIEDDAVLAQSIAEIVLEGGYRPVTVSTLAQARPTMAKDPPGLIILDLTLDSEFGGDLLEELSQSANAPPVLVVSAFSLAKMVASRYGVPVVTKPFGIRELFAAVEQAFAEKPQPRRVAT